MKKKLFVAFLCMLIACTLTAVLFACGKAKTYTVTYEKSEMGEVGTVPVDDAKYKKDAFVTLQSPDDLTLENYHFVGWNDGEKTYALTDEFKMPDHDVTFQAVWEINTYTVTYMNSLEEPESAHVIAERYVAGEIHIVHSNVWFDDPNGREYVGWLDDGGAAYTDGEAYIMPAHDVTFVCNWRVDFIRAFFYSEGEEYAVKDYGINRYGVDEKSVNINSLPPAPTPREGYDFLGWYREGEDERFTVNYTNFTEDDYKLGAIYLYAKWEQRYTVVYRQLSDGGESYTVETTYSKGASFDLMPLPYGWEVEGKEFLGWSVNGGESLKQPGTSYLISAADSKTIVFTAVWEITSVKVTFYTDTNEVYLTQDYSIYNPIELPEEPGEGFGGWFTLSGVEFNADYVFTEQDKASGELAVYARWLQSVKLVYLRNGNASDTVQFEESYYEGDFVTLATLPNDWQVEDKDFLGWEVDGVRYQPGQSFQLDENSDSTVYARAVWNYKAFTIYYYWSEGDTDPYLVVPVEQGAVIVVLVLDFTSFEEGAFFLGWYLENGEEFDNSYVLSNEDLDGNGVLHVYGRWEHRYSIVYRQYGEDGETYTDGITYLITDPVELISLPNDWADEGKRFLGWSVNGGATLAAGTNYSIRAEDSATIVFTAVWEIIAVKVTFFTEESEIYDTVYYGFEDPLVLPSAPTQAVFGGWFTASGEKFNEDYVFTASDKQLGELAVYAKWLQPTRIVYMRNGSGQDTLSFEDPETYYEGDAVILAELPVTWEVAGKGFFGWEVNGVRYQAGASFQLEGNEGGTIYIRAVWKEVAFTIYYYVTGDEEPYRIVLIAQGEELTVLELDPDVFEEGATFGGWYLENGKDFNSDYVFSEEDADENGVLHVYAWWNYPDEEDIA